MNMVNAIGGASGLALWGAGVGAAGAAAVHDKDQRPTMVALTGIGAGAALLGIGMTPGPFEPVAAKARIYALCALPLAAGIAGGAALASTLLD